MSPVKIVGCENRFKRVWRWIMEEKVGMIAVTGEWGIGKTTLLRLLHDKLSSTGSYSLVIWVTVSEDFQLGKVQDEIWGGTGSSDEKWAEKTTKEKAKCIFDVLIQKKFVLFLDDIWQPINLKSLGIPHLRAQNESTVILSSRRSSRCMEMDVERIMRLDRLTDEAAWSLFQMKIDEDILIGDENIIELAKGISSLCCGSPILLCMVAAAMACKKTYQEWEFALEFLRNQYERPGIFDLLQFCYDSLPNDMVKSCFLYFSLFPQHFTIPKSDLIDFWISEELFGHYDTRGDALDLGYNVMDILLRSNLFKDENDYVKMLDMIRYFALCLIMRLKKFHNAQLITVTYVAEHIIDKTFTKNAPTFRKNAPGVGRISSMKNIVPCFPNITPDLLTFFPQHNPFIMIENKDMMGLMVLDLSRSSIEEVPRQISKLVSLQHLNLSYTYIDKLPIELKKLKKLKCLNLENNDQLRMIPKQVISNLLSLQVLRMFHCGYSLSGEENKILCATFMDISEQHGLKSLEVLSITITCSSSLKDFFNSKILSRCTHALSLEVFWRTKLLDISSVAAMEHLLTLEIHQAEWLSDIKVNSVMDRSFVSLREVTVEKCLNLQDLSWLILASNLAILRVSSCPEMEDIISVEKLGEILNHDRNPFAKIKVLELESLCKLKSIYWKALPFEFLKKLQVFDCPQLKKLPLDAQSAKRKASNTEDVEIIAEENWWKQVEWDGAAENRFRYCFN